MPTTVEIVKGVENPVTVEVTPVATVIVPKNVEVEFARIVEGMNEETFEMCEALVAKSETGRGLAIVDIITKVDVDDLQPGCISYSVLLFVNTKVA